MDAHNPVVMLSERSQIKEKRRGFYHVQFWKMQTKLQRQKVGLGLLGAARDTQGYQRTYGG